MLKKLAQINKINIIWVFLLPFLAFLLAEIIVTIALFGFKQNSTFYLYGVFALVGSVMVLISTINITHRSFTTVLSMSQTRKSLLISTLVLCYLLSIAVNLFGFLLSEIDEFLVLEVFSKHDLLQPFEIAGGRTISTRTFLICAAVMPLLGILVGALMHKFGTKIFFLMFLFYLIPIAESQVLSAHHEIIQEVAKFGIPILGIAACIWSIFYLLKAPVK